MHISACTQLLKWVNTYFQFSIEQYFIFMIKAIEYLNYYGDVINACIIICIIILTFHAK